MYTAQDLYIADGKPTTVIFLWVTHDSSAAVFNSLDLARRLDEREASIRVCHIQSSKIVIAGYFQGSTKTLNEEHWTTLLNFQPCLKYLDVEVQICNIKDPTSDSQDAAQKTNMSKNKSLAAHVLCSKKTRRRSTLRYAPRTVKRGKFLEQQIIFLKDEL